MVRIRGIKLPFHLFVARVMKTIAYLRVWTGSQDLANQKLAVLDYARQKRFAIDHFVEAQASSRKGRDQRRIEELLGSLTAGDRLVVSELSRLGRSLGQVIQLVDELVKRKVRFTAIKEGIRFEGKQDLQTKVMIALFGLFAEVERDLISERTKEGLAAARAKGRLLGRPKGSLGTSKLDGKEGEIRKLLEKEVSKRSLARIMDVSTTNLRHFIRTRKLAPEALKGTSKSQGEVRGLRAYFCSNLGGALSCLPWSRRVTSVNTVQMCQVRSHSTRSQMKYGLLIVCSHVHLATVIYSSWFARKWDES